jgi:diacylglycerol O-acyltransferase / wax synthase
MNREPLSNFDAFILHMDSPTNKAVITGLMIFDKPVEFERLRATIQHRMLEFDRFRQRIGEDGRFIKRPAWEFDPFFNLDAHLHRIGLPAPGDLAALQALTSDLMSTPLDMGKPPWQMHLVESYGEGSALIIRMHHSIADGVSLVQVLLSMIDFGPDAPWPVALTKRNGYRGTRLGRLLMPPLRMTSRALNLADRVLSKSLDVMENPELFKYKTFELAADADVLARYLLGEDEPETSLRGVCGVAKKATWSEPLRLDEVKALGKAMGGTVNDIMLTAVAGALRRYFLGRGEAIDYPELRAVVPFNMRTNTGPGGLGNQLGMVMLKLPVGLDEMPDRFDAVKKRMDELKESRDPHMIYGLLSSAVFDLPLAQNLVLDMISSKASLLVTNVPGPQMELYFAGRALKSMIFWVPQPVGWGLGLSLFSYNGVITLGVACDAGLIPDPEAIATAFLEEFRAMQALSSNPAEALAE